MAENIEATKPEDNGDLGPIVDGVAKIAKFAEKTDKDVRARVDEIKAATDKGLADLSEKLERTAGSVLDRVEQLSKRASVFGNINVTQDNASAVKESLTAQAKSLLPRYESLAKKTKSSELSDPVLYGAAAEWFKMAAQLQVQKFRNKIGLAEAFQKLDGTLNAVQKLALQENVAGEGGNLVPTIVAPEILRQILDASQLWPGCRQYPMTKKVHQIPDQATAVTVNWVAEEGTLTGGEPTFGQKTLTANKLAGRSTFSLELLEDSNVALLPYLLTVFTEKMAGELDFQTMEGTSPFTGVNTASSVVAQATNGGGTGAALTYPMLTAMLVGAGESSSRESGVFVMNPAIYGKVIGLVDSTGQPIVKFGTVETAPMGTLLGRPIIVTNRLGTFDPGDASVTANIYFGPLNSLVAGTRTALNWDVTDQVNWTTYQGDARLIGRFGYVVGVPTDWVRLTKIDAD